MRDLRKSQVLIFSTIVFLLIAPIKARAHTALSFGCGTGCSAEVQKIAGPKYPYPNVKAYLVKIIVSFYDEQSKLAGRQVTRKWYVANCRDKTYGEVEDTRGPEFAVHEPLPEYDTTANGNARSKWEAVCLGRTSRGQVIS